MDGKHYEGLITWVTTLKHVLASRRAHIGGYRQSFEAGAACGQANETLRNRGCQV